MKKTIIIITMIISTLIVALFSYAYYVNNIQIHFTGFTYSTPPPSEIIEKNAVYKLQNALPFKTDVFSINKFDYSVGKFIVIFPIPVKNPEVDFEVWHKNSSFSDIPISMFKFIINDPRIE